MYIIYIYICIHIVLFCVSRVVTESGDLSERRQMDRGTDLADPNRFLPGFS